MRWMAKGLVRSMTALVVAGGWALAPASAQAPGTPPESDMGAPPRPVSVLLIGKPLVTVLFTGDYGPVRVTGALESAPKEALELTDLQGKSRQVDWTDIRALSQVTSPSEGLPIGSFIVYLTSDAPSGSSGGSGYLTPGLAAPAVSRGGWRLSKLSPGEISIRSASVGLLAFPVSRLTSWSLEPVRGTVTQLPKASVRIEALAGKSIQVPLVDLEYFRRDLRLGTITITLTDGQVFSGKLLEMPKVNLMLEGATKLLAIPLDTIVQFELSGPTSSRSLASQRF